MTERGNKIACILGILGSVVLLGVLVGRVVRRAWNDSDVTPRQMEARKVVEVPVATNQEVEVKNPVAVVATNKPATPRAQVVAVSTNEPVRQQMSAPRVSANMPAARQVRLANRTISLERGRRKFPAKFAELQKPSARGTVAFVIVSELPVSKMVRDRASACGARVIGFMPVNSLIVEANAKTLKKLEDDAFFAAAYELDPKDKVQAHMRELVAKNQKTVDVTVLPLMATDIGPLESFVKTQGGRIIPADDTRNVLRARVSAATVDALTARGDVRWIERYVPASLQNNVAVKPGLMNVQPVWDVHGLTGRGQFLTCADSGLDSGDPTTVMDDFQGRIVAIRSTAATTLKKDIFGHGTHVAGSLVGTGARSDGEIKGVAHGARLWVWGSATEAGELIFPDWEEMFQPNTNVCPAYIHSESWGYQDASLYTSFCQTIDEWLWDHPEHLVVFAAGNCMTARKIMDPAGAKNVLAVGATESFRPDSLYGTYADNVSQMASFSAPGPMGDGRIKPDLCAPGTKILSVKSSQAATSMFKWGTYAANPNYIFNSGTSMSAPLVAGSAALVREWLVDRRGFTNALPTAALLKTILMGGAYDMSVDVNADCGGAAPNNRQGWGRVDLGETLYPSNRAVKVFDRIPFSAGSECVYRVVATSRAPLDVQLVWLDYPAQSLAGSALVNDLDLVVSNETTGAVWWGNGAMGGDRVNTVESVRIGAAEPATYAIRVRGAAVPYDSTEGGAAAVYVRGAFEGEFEVASEEGEDSKVYPLRYRSQFPRLEDWGTTETVMVASGKVVRVSIPEDLPDGAERLTGLEWTDAAGGKTSLEEQRLAEVVRAEDGSSEGEIVLDASGRMPETFEVSVEAPTDVLFRYYGISAMNDEVGLPDWWYRRYLAGATGERSELAKAEADADGDGVSNADEYAADTDPVDAESVFRIVSFSPTNIVWRGGSERTQVVERAESVGRGAVWTGVYTNLPPTAREGIFAIPSANSNSFYRIRAF